MKRSVCTIAALTFAAAFSTMLLAQKVTEVHPGKGGSPHVKTEAVIDGANISITYGRPALKGRTVGQEVAPYGKEWRTGADEATTLVTDKMIMFGSVHLNPGTYTLYTVPNEKEWQLIVSKKTGQWGIPYPAGEDVGRAPMTVSQAPAAAEQLTITIEDAAKGGVLHVDWGTTRASIPFTVG